VVKDYKGAIMSFAFNVKITYKEDGLQFEDLTKFLKAIGFARIVNLTYKPEKLTFIYYETDEEQFVADFVREYLIKDKPVIKYDSDGLRSHETDYEHKPFNEIL